MSEQRIRELSPEETAIAIHAPEQEQHICMGLDCLEIGKWDRVQTWIHVHRWRYPGYSWYFCSLRCLANWLARELAREEAESQQLAKEQAHE